MTVKTWNLTDLPGDGRGGIFWNNETSFVDERTGLTVLDHDGYNEDDDFDEFGYEFYTCTVKGTEDQVMKFIEEYFYGEGEFSEE